MTQPEVCRDQSANGGICDRWSLLAGQSQANRVESVQTIAHEAEVLLQPQLVEALVLPGLGGGGVEKKPATTFAFGIEGIVLRDLAGGWVCDVRYTGLAVDDPNLLTGRGYKNAHVLLRVAHAKTEGVP